MASMTKMAAAAKLAEDRIRLDIGDDISVEDEVTKSREQQFVWAKLPNGNKCMQCLFCLSFAWLGRCSTLQSERHSSVFFAAGFGYWALDNWYTDRFGIFR